MECLRAEMIKALGCTEPIAIAYVSATARKALGCMPERVVISCSNNVIKNAKSVLIPMTDSMRGIDSACMVGVVGGNVEKKLEVLSDVGPEELELAKKLLAQGVCEVRPLQSGTNLHIIVEVFADGHSAMAELMQTHLGITRIVRDGEALFEDKSAATTDAVNYDCLSIDNIFAFTMEAKLEDIAPLMEEQMKCNLAIAEEGLRSNYGANVGKTLMESGSDDVRIRARAMAAAGSDARMNGCDMPVVINSGSGNQGITLTLPVMVYAEHLGCSHEKTIRALTFSNLMAMYLKHGMGRLSAFCGAVSAAAGAGAAITYLYGGTRKQIEDTVTNALANVSGIICDGANSSCAAKISTAVDAAILGGTMALRGRVVEPGEGIVKDSLQQTTEGVIEIGRDGMQDTDRVVLEVMLK